MHQLSLLEPSCSLMKEVVNISKVPQRSPFRYPGGKTWLIPQIRQWLSKVADKDSILIEPFAGGGITSITAVAEKAVNKAIMVEIDDDIASVWKTIIYGQGDLLAKAIKDFNLTSENIESLLNNISSEDLRALATIIRNRISHGGILANGAGFLKNGENGKGIRSRWYPETLYKRIMDIVGHKQQIEFVHGDGFKAIEQYTDLPNCIFFIDPPYTKAGRRLYKHSDIDHKRLFELASNLKGNFLITYDDSEEIRQLADDHKFEVREILMKGTQNLNKKELLISYDLSWIQVVNKQ